MSCGCFLKTKSRQTPPEKSRVTNSSNLHVSYSDSSFQRFSVEKQKQERNSSMQINSDFQVKKQSTSSNHLILYKIVVLGEGNVGKSALVFQFVTHNFLEYHDPTIEDAYQQQAVVDGEPALLDILDTAGQLEFTAMRDQYMRCGEGFVICYSITDRRSFDEAAQYYAQIKRIRQSDAIPIVLVATKCDLEYNRKVTSEEGKTLARQLNCPFYETSAALGHFVDDVFYGLVREIRTRKFDAVEKCNQSRFSQTKLMRLALWMWSHVKKRTHITG